MLHKNMYLIALLLNFPILTQGQSEPYQVLWEKTISGDLSDTAEGVAPTVDGGAILVGDRVSLGRSVMNSAWIAKVKSNGVIEWEQICSFGQNKNTSIEMISSVAVSRSDGSVYAVGTASPPSMGNSLLCKLRAKGEFESIQTTLGKHNEFNIVGATPDGGVVVGGHTGSNQNSADLRIVKFLPNSTIQWDVTFGTEHWDEVRAIKALKDGSILVGGYVSTSSRGYVWLHKLDSQGNQLWEKNIGLQKYEYAWDIETSDDGSIFLIGRTNSHDKDRKPFEIAVDKDTDMWVVKTAPDGSLLWQKRFGEIGEDEGRALVPLPSGGALLVGTLDLGESDHVWVVSIDESGKKKWETTLCEQHSCEARDASLLADGSLLIVGNYKENGNFKNPSKIWLSKINLYEARTQQIE